MFKVIEMMFDMSQNVPTQAKETIVKDNLSAHLAHQWADKFNNQEIKKREAKEQDIIRSYRVKPV